MGGGGRKKQQQRRTVPNGSTQQLMRLQHWVTATHTPREGRVHIGRQVRCRATGSGDSTVLDFQPAATPASAWLLNWS